MKWLHREIMLSAAYRQSSKPRPEAESVDATNTLLWRMNPRRLDIESYRDTLLRASGKLNEEMYGPSEDLDSDHQRSPHGLRAGEPLAREQSAPLYDFPDPSRLPADAT